jgi:hypothetical protein
MSASDVFGLVVFMISRLFCYALVRREADSATVSGIAQIAVYVIVLLALTPLLGSYDAGLRGRWRPSGALVRPAERAFWLLRTSPRIAELAPVRPQRAWLSILFLIPQAAAPGTAAEPDGVSRVSPGRMVIPPRVVTNTNWQYYGASTP